MIPGDGLAAATVVFVASGIVLLVTGPRAVRLADRLADLTGLGEAVMGAVFLGAVTSLPDIMASAAPALAGAPSQALGNALGGITIQTAFLAVADITYRRANLEHAAVSVPNMIQGTTLVALLAIVVVAGAGPDVDLWGLHPATPLLVAGYLYGVRLASEATDNPMWEPSASSDTVADVPDDDDDGQGDGASTLWLRFAGLALVLAASGWLLGRSGVTIAEETGLSGTAVGALLTAVTTSLSELVVAVSAIRQGALALAVGDIIGGNTFDVLIVAVADVTYRDGSIYHQLTADHLLIIGLGILLTSLLLMGLLRRERHGVANIGFESAAVLVLYAGGALLLLS